MMFPLCCDRELCRPHPLPLHRLISVMPLLRYYPAPAEAKYLKSGLHFCL